MVESHILIGKIYFQLFLSFAYVFVDHKLHANLFNIWFCLLPSIILQVKKFLVKLWEFTAR